MIKKWNSPKQLIFRYSLARFSILVVSFLALAALVWTFTVIGIAAGIDSVVGQHLMVNPMPKSQPNISIAVAMANLDNQFNIGFAIVVGLVALQIILCLALYVLKRKMNQSLAESVQGWQQYTLYKYKLNLPYRSSYRYGIQSRFCGKLIILT